MPCCEWSERSAAMLPPSKGNGPIGGPMAMPPARAKSPPAVLPSASSPRRCRRCSARCRQKASPLSAPSCAISAFLTSTPGAPRAAFPRPIACLPWANTWKRATSLTSRWEWRPRCSSVECAQLSTRWRKVCLPSIPPLPRLADGPRSPASMRRCEAWSIAILASPRIWSAKADRCAAGWRSCRPSPSAPSARRPHPPPRWSQPRHQK